MEKFKKEAEAKGFPMLVQAFGGGEAYSLYTFAGSFMPDSIQIFYAGEGTFWTDLTRLQDIAAGKLLGRASSTDASTKPRK